MPRLRPGSEAQQPGPPPRSPHRCPRWCRTARSPARAQERWDLDYVQGLRPRWARARMLRLPRRPAAGRLSKHRDPSRRLLLTALRMGRRVGGVKGLTRAWRMMGLPKQPGGPAWRSRTLTRRCARAATGAGSQPASALGRHARVCSVSCTCLLNAAGACTHAGTSARRFRCAAARSAANRALLCREWPIGAPKNQVLPLCPLHDRVCSSVWCYILSQLRTTSINVKGNGCGQFRQQARAFACNLAMHVSSS